MCKTQGLYFALILAPWTTMAMGRTLNIGNTVITLQNQCTTDHKLNVQIGNELLCAPLTTEWADNSVHVAWGGVTYTVCDGECGSGEYIMPETPPEPVVITDPECTGPTLNPNAYLLSNGNQWFDTGVGVDSSVNIELTVQVNNGKHARIFGTKNSTCHFDFTLNKNSAIVFRMGSNTSAASTTLQNPHNKKKITYWTQQGRIDGTQPNYKYVYATATGMTRREIRQEHPTSCSDSSKTILVFDNDLINAANLDPTQSGGMKLYYIKMYNSSGTLIHDFEPVPSGTNVCGHTARTNCMWDTVDKKLYYPAGTGAMGYGVDQ